MKTIFSTIALFSAVLFATSCTEDMEYKDSKVSSVNQLYEPTDGKEVVLQSSASASLFFEWESAKAEDSGAPLYEVVFDKEGGDFSKPIYKVLSDNGGSLSYATISHKTLNKVGAAAGLNSGETGTLVWTVMASRGLNSVMAKESKKLTITRLVGFEEIPAQLYLTGSATEGGMDASATTVYSPVGRQDASSYTRWNREFQAYSLKQSRYMEGGKTYKLVDRAAEGAKVFYINGNKIMEGEGETTVEKTGVYRIEMDFSIASVTVREVSKMEFYFCPSGAATFELPYVGNGVFCGQDKIEFKQEGWGRDQRYKFLMTYADGSIQYWGTKNTTDSNPGAATPEDPYFYIMETPDNQWDQKWKLNNEFDGAADGHNPGAITKISVIFNVENYTHKVELAN